MRVSAVIPTRGNVDMQPIIDSLACFDEVLIWDNSVRQELGVYGRYAMIEEARNELVFTQDDDVIVSDPQAIAKAWVLQCARLEEIGQYQGIVANMPQEFRHEGYTDSCLVGFGACFHRSAPARAFIRFRDELLGPNLTGFIGPRDFQERLDEEAALINRTCDVIFTTLTPRVLVDVPKVDREFASDQDRMWRQSSHYGERVKMLELARQVRDA